MGLDVKLHMTHPDFLKTETQQIKCHYDNTQMEDVNPNYPYIHSFCSLKKKKRCINLIYASNLRQRLGFLLIWHFVFGDMVIGKDD